MGKTSSGRGQILCRPQQCLGSLWPWRNVSKAVNGWEAEIFMCPLLHFSSAQYRHDPAYSSIHSHTRTQFISGCVCVCVCLQSRSRWWRWAAQHQCSFSLRSRNTERALEEEADQQTFPCHQVTEGSSAIFSQQQQKQKQQQHKLKTFLNLTMTQTQCFEVRFCSEPSEPSRD